MSSDNSILQLSPSNGEDSSNSIQTLMIINDPDDDKAVVHPHNNHNSKLNEVSLEISHSGCEEGTSPAYIQNCNVFDHILSPDNEPVRHISALSFLKDSNKNLQAQKPTMTMIPNSNSNIMKETPKKAKETTEMGSSIKIVHSRSSSESTEQMHVNDNNRQISYTSLSVQSSQLRQKENAQPNQSNPSFPSHQKADTVI